ncbi:lymphocyte function-associated antigen 3 [Lonchura striata]|uniref:Lymphocyte function-associated antigen 3 n=1 Tax=Lonchura striata TaxID=40157 RepID=A0A218VD60_9PASE|nr:lymphocyte function-associated antigen 3 [Lonchura striata domestica]OWK64005.1 Lymphocyte function-associated antigen 3 [Lonchura striata domestica]
MWRLASLLCLSPLLAQIYCEDIAGIMGENFTFPVQIDHKIVEATWKKNKDKVAEWEEQNKPIYLGPLRNRSVLMENGSLTIVNLQKGDAGTYELLYRDFMGDHNLNFVLSVLDSLPKPKISCNTSDDKLVLNCTANFQRSLNYAWKLSNNPQSYQTQELSIPVKNVDITTNATCIIKFSQTERRSEISLLPCLPEGKGGSSQERHRYYIIAAVILVVGLVGITVLLHKKDIIKLGTGRRTAQNNSAMNGSGEHEQLFPGNSEQQSNSQGAAFSHTVDCGNEEPEADRALSRDMNEEDKQIVKNGVNQEEVTQDTEGGNGGQPNNSSSSTKEDKTADEPVMEPGTDLEQCIAAEEDPKA